MQPCQGLRRGNPTPFFQRGSDKSRVGQAKPRGPLAMIKIGFDLLFYFCGAPKLEQVIRLAPQRLVPAAGLLQKGWPRRGSALQGSVKDVFDLPPTFGWHGPRAPTISGLAPHQLLAATPARTGHALCYRAVSTGPMYRSSQFSTSRMRSCSAGIWPASN